MIELSAVSKSFAGVKVLDSMSLAVPTGHVCALLGLSGSGKTTILKLVCGLHFVDAGEVKVRDIVVNRETLSDVRSLLGYVTQDGGLFPHMTAFENIHLAVRELGWSVQKVNARVEELADLTKLSSSLLDRYPRQLSGGQRQRVGLMRALLRDPPILLLDEPMGALDPITRSDLQTELLDLFKRLRKTVLLVTHDLYEAGYLSERTLLLNKGQIVQEGTLEDLIKNPANEFVHRFVQSQRHHTDGL